MDLKLAEASAELVEVWKNRKAEHKQVLREFDEAHNNAPAGDVLTMEIGATKHSDACIVALEGEGEIALMRSFLSELFIKRVQDAERDIYALQEPQEPTTGTLLSLSKLNERRDHESVRLLVRNRFEPDALYLNQEYLTEPNAAFQLDAAAFLLHIQEVRNYNDTVQEWIGDARKVYFVLPNGGVHLIKHV